MKPRNESAGDGAARHRPSRTADDLTSRRIPLIRTTDVDEARQAFRGTYADATLEPARSGPFRWTLDLVPCGTVSLLAGHWNAGFRAVAPAIDGRHILALSDGGTSSGEHAGKSYAIIPGRSGAVFSPGRNGRKGPEPSLASWKQGCSGVVVPTRQAEH